MDPNFFGLSGNPFARSDSEYAPCMAEEHSALSAELTAGLKAPHGITLLIGEQGAGKTTFVRNFLAQLPETYVTAYLPTAGPGLRHLLTEIVEQLGGTVVAGGQEQALIDTVRSLAKARAEHERATLIVIDDAHELPAKTIERLGKLFGTDAAEPSRLHVTLVGRPELLDRMNAANDRSILKHLVQVCRMDAIGPEDALRYIADRVQRVGGIVERLFSEDALRLIVQRAKGNPSRIDDLCAAALTRAEERGVAVVDAATVEAIGSGVIENAEAEASNVAKEERETPTYFFNEDEDEDERAAEGNAVISTAQRAVPREGAKVAVPASRRRLAYWAAGAIAAAIVVAWAMTGTGLLGGGRPRADDATGQQLAAKERPRRAAADAKGRAESDEPVAVPKLVVKRGAKAAPGGAAETPEPAKGAVAQTAQPAPDTAPERPRFPAPPLAPAPGEGVVAEPAQAAVKAPGELDAAPPAPGVPPAAEPSPVKAAEVPAAPAQATQPAAGAPPPPTPAQIAKVEPAGAGTAKAAAPTAQPAAKPVATPVPPSRPAAPAKPTVAPPLPVKTAAAKPSATAASAAAGRYTVQLGAFSSRANAESLLAKARPVSRDGRIIASSAGGKPVFRVVAGSFATQAEANAHAATLKKSGYTTFVRKLD